MFFARQPIVARRVALAAGLAVLLAGCEAGGGLDLGGFNLGTRFEEGRTAPRPEADARGVITYPNYQVVLARQGDTVGDVATRIGLTPSELARHNGLSTDSTLRAGELLALPRPVSARSGVDIESIASAAIDDADGSDVVTTVPVGTSTVEPLRHKVERGETAYSIARLYAVSVTALANYNGLGSDLSVREGQTLLIPVVENATGRRADNSKPGTGSTTPEPPSARKPLPEDVETARLPDSPDLGKQKTNDDRKFLMPVQGKIIQDYSGKAGGNEGIDIAASTGTAVKAAEDGDVALVSKSVGSNTIVLLRHADNLYTVYSNVTGVKVVKGDKVKRGQPLGTVGSGNPPFLHFEVRRGTQSVDPKPFL